MKIEVKGGMIATALALSVMSLTPAYAGQNITLCGASPGGLWSLLGAGLDAAVRKVDPDSNVTYQTSSGGFANIAQLKQGGCDLAIAHIGEVLIGSRGEAPFSEPMGGISAVALMYNWAPMQWVIDREYAAKNGLSSISDLAKMEGSLNLVVNRKGILPSILAEQALAQAGYTFSDIEAKGGSVQFQGSETAAEVMQDRKADAWVNATFIGDKGINAIATARELTLLSVPAEITAEMSKKYGSIAVKIPAGAYPWLDKDVETFGAQAALISTENANPEIVALVTKAIIEHTVEIQGVHKSMSAFSVELSASISSFPYHAAAAEAYKAAGQ